MSFDARGFLQFHVGTWRIKQKRVSRMEPFSKLLYDFGERIDIVEGPAE